MKHIICVMGPTNSGKTTFIEQLIRDQKRFHGVFVGRALRAKYPPEYFEGRDSPAHTAAEAENLLTRGCFTAWDQGKIPVLDGQPRDAGQLDYVRALGKHHAAPVIYSMLWCPREMREARAIARDADDEKALELSASRMDRDAASLYELERLLCFRYGHNVFHISTKTPESTKAGVSSLCRQLEVPELAEGQS